MWQLSQGSLVGMCPSGLPGAWVPLWQLAAGRGAWAWAKRRAGETVGRVSWVVKMWLVMVGTVVEARDKVRFEDGIREEVMVAAFAIRLGSANGALLAEREMCYFMP